jgi:hypothetical protein
MEAVVLVVELGQRCDRQGWHYDVLCSLAGQDRVMSRTWDSKTQLSASQAADLVSYVATATHNALLAWGGVQEVLDA